jgi:hypothetical protein
LRGGLPHSDIPGSPIARISPGLFAACHVLHRLSVPRHPPDALPSRLSATPNGKNHLRRNRRFRRGDRRSVSFAESPGPIPVPPASLSQARHSSLLGGTCKAPPLEDTIGIPHAQTSRPLRRMDPASVTQLAYSHLSINNRPRRPSQPSGGNLFLHAAYRVRGCPRRAFRRNCVSPVGLGETCGFTGGGGERDRTDDLLLAKQALSQLSYTPLPGISHQGSVIRTDGIGAAGQARTPEIGGSDP